ncbi:MAG TPA: ATP-dependent Zn protease [Nodosilinea sp.]|nr:ATP-dependent Zn protease [Nodosilinea sp.]
MRDTTLNAVAITIFGVTMASLLGPLVQLSPAVVAVFAAVGLGVFSVDQLGLGGRIGGILMDAVAWTSLEHRQRVLHHEAGHFLAAVLLDLPVEAYTLTAWESWRQGMAGEGGVVFGPSDPATAASLRLTPQSIDRYCQVWMAGIAAEQMIYGSAEGGDNDQAALGRFWQALGRSADEVPLKRRWAALQAKTLLEKHRAAFDALVVAMGDRAPVAHCREVIDQHRAEVEVSR